MPVFLNPFQKHDVADFPNTYVPLQHAQRHASVVAAQGDKLAGLRGDESPKADGVKGEETARPDELTLDALRSEIDADESSGGHDTAYDRKAKVINKAITDIGMGPYQWKLFILCGFGWLADNMWLQTVALTLPSLSQEFGPSETNVRYTTCALFIGLCFGASFWGTASDVIGRRLAFNATLFLAGVFGLGVGGGPNWIGTCALYSSLGIGIGGNLPVDGALFLEFIPTASQGLLTLLSVWWPVGQLVSSLAAWGFLTNYKCAEDLAACPAPPGQECCTRDKNMGWRYLNITMGAITFFMFVCRFFLFHLFESPKFLLSRGRQAEAVATVRGIAYMNKKKTWISEDVLNAIGGNPEVTQDEKLATIEIIKRTFSKFSTQRVKPLFGYKKLAINTALVWFCWFTIGMGYPLFNAFLPQYLANTAEGSKPTPNSIVYRNYAITSIVGVPGSIIAAYTVDIKWLGRKGTIAIATLITGIFTFVFTASPDSNFQLAFSSLEAFFQSKPSPFLSFHQYLTYPPHHTTKYHANDGRHHVRRSLCIHARGLPCAKPRYRHRYRILPEPYRWPSRSHHRC